MTASARVARFARVAVPLTVAAAVLLAWPASYLFEFRGAVAVGRRFVVDTGPGWFTVTALPTAGVGPPLRGSISPLTADRRHAIQYPRVYSAAGEYHFFAPFWVAELAAVLAAAAVLATRRLVRRTPGVCRACGYDLRATPGRCPECGTAVVRT